jgi:hypothetical protein
MKQLTISRRGFVDLLPAGLDIIEIGVYKGSYAKTLSKCKPAHLTLLDVWRHIDAETVYGKYDSCNESDEKHLNNYKRVQNMFASQPEVEIVRDFSENYVKNIPNGRYDVIYIDADHSYEGLTTDLNNWKDKIKDSGFIYGHDYTTKAKWIEVPRALHDFLEKNPEWDFVAITAEKGSPSWIIAKSGSIIYDVLKEHL